MLTTASSNQVVADNGRGFPSVSFFMSAKPFYFYALFVSENFCKKKMCIMNTADKNGYDSKMIESMIKKKVRTMERKNLTTLYS